MMWPGRGDNRRAAAFVRQARGMHGWLDSPSKPASFTSFQRRQPLFTQATTAQTRYYRYFRQRILAGQGARGDTGYVHLFGQEAAAGTLPDGQARHKALLKLLAHAQEVGQDTRAAVALWVLDAVALDHVPGGVPLAAAYTASAHLARHAVDLALQGLLERIHGAAPLSPPTLDARVIIGKLPELPFDAYGAPQPFTNQLALATLIAVDNFFLERSPARKTLIDTFPSPEPVHLQRHGFDEILYDGPTHPHGRLASAPAHHDNQPLLQTLRHALYMGQKLVLQQLGVPGEQYVTDDRFTHQVATHVASDLHEFIRQATIPVELFRLQPGSLVLDEASDKHGESIDRSEETIRRLLSLDHPTYLTPEQRYQQRLEVHRELAARSIDAEPRTNPTESSDLLEWNPAQRDWYVWWRQQWRLDNVLPSPRYHAARAYAFELLNLIGFDTPEDAYAELMRVVAAMHDGQERPFWDVLNWPLLMAMRYELPDSPARAHFLARSLWPPPHSFDPACLTGWLQHRDYNELTLDTFGDVLGFNPHAGVYLDRARHPDRYEAGLRAAVRATDEHFQAVHGSSLFEHPRLLPFDGALADPTAPTWHYREFFGEDAKPVRLLLAPPHAETLEFQAFMDALLKHVENAFRKADGVNGSRRVNSHPLLTPALLTAVDRAIQPWLGEPKPQVTLSFDPTEVEALEARSAATRELLITDEARAEAQRDPAPAAPAIGIPTPVDVGGLTGPAADAGEYVEFVTDLNHLHQALLQLLLQGASLETLERAARDHKALLGAALDEINEVALTALGDTVVDAAAEPPALIDEHTPALRAALAEAPA